VEEEAVKVDYNLLRSTIHTDTFSFVEKEDVPMAVEQQQDFL